MKSVDGPSRAWVLSILVTKSALVLVCLAILITAVFDYAIHQKVGSTADGTGLFWLLGVSAILSVLASIVFRALNGKADRGIEP